MRDQFLSWSLAVLLIALIGYIGITSLKIESKHDLKPQQVQGPYKGSPSQEGGTYPGNGRNVESRDSTTQE